MKKKILVLASVLALLSAMIFPGDVMAANTTDVTGSVTSGYSFSAPSAVALGAMSPSVTPHKANSSDGSLVGNNAAGYTVTGIDEKGTSTGFMVSGANVLGNKLQISYEDANYVDADTNKNFLDTTGPTNATVSLYVSQMVTYTDPVATGYSITITFTVTEN